jgi:hypothetical protein
MTTKPKDTQAPMSGAFAQALARHMAAQAALDAVPGPEDYPEHLSNEEGEALNELAFTPCASDAELAPDLGADQGLRLVDSRERASHNATGVFAGPGEPGDCPLQGSKSFIWVETSRHRDRDSIQLRCDA